MKGAGPDRCRTVVMPPNPLTDAELVTLDRWWRAANYLSVGQIYLLGAPPPDQPWRPS